MVEQAMLRHFFILRTRFSVVVVRIDRDTATWCEFPPHFEIARFHQFHEIFPDDVDAVLVEVTVVSEAEQIQLQRLRLDEFLIRDVRDVDGCEVRLVRDWAQ